MYSITELIIGSIVFFAVSMVSFVVDAVMENRRGKDFEPRNFWYNNGCIFFGMTMALMIQMIQMSI